jgi:hypothetical protein
MAHRGIRRERAGTYRVTLSRDEREVLAALPAQLSGLDPGDPSLRRLSPPAHADDPEADAEYRRLVGESLLDGRRAALDGLERTAHAERLTLEELESWLGALESLRLVLGTQLDVTEESYGMRDPGHPDAHRFAVYHWLSWLQEEVVRALAATLPAGAD